MSLETIGRLHPLLVHMPIGFLALALVVDAYGSNRNGKPQTTFNAGRFLWLLGASTAAVSCMTGLLLEREGGPAGDLTDRHKWSAIATTLLASFGYASTFVHGGTGSDRLFRRSVRACVLTGLLLTSHFGGSITHGEGYLTSALPKPFREGRTAESPQGVASVTLQNPSRGPRGADSLKTPGEWPSEDVPHANPAVLARLRSTGMVVLPVVPGEGRLQANLVNLSVPADSALRLLGEVSGQLVWLKADVKGLTDSGCAHLAKLTGLTRLSLSGTSVTDRGLTRLAGLRKLRKLNLTGTVVTGKGLESMGMKPELKELYLFGTAVDRYSLEGLDSLFPSAVVDTGGYRLQRSAADTLAKSRTKTR